MSRYSSYTSSRPRLKRVIPMPEWLEARGISYDTMRRLRMEGKLRVTQISPNRLGVHEDDDDAYTRRSRRLSRRRTLPRLTAGRTRSARSWTCTE
jgi:hypothetical protein